MFDTGMKLKKKKKISIHCSSEINTFQDLLQCLSESVRVYTVYYLSSLYGTTIPDPELLRQLLRISIILS